MNSIKDVRSSKFRGGSRIRQTPEIGWRTYQPKRCGNNNKDENNSPKNLNDKNHQASSQILEWSEIIMKIITQKLVKKELSHTAKNNVEYKNSLHTHTHTHIEIIFARVSPLRSG